jgi:ribosomal protein S18 acetylase RimI-like enzyme
MHITIASVRPQDESFLWIMIYYAAHMELDGDASLFAAKDHPYVKRYVSGWGAPNDIGVIGYDDGEPVGAVWSRLLIGENKTYGYVDDETPELAAAVLPDYTGKGIGTKLLRAYLNRARHLYPAVTLTVRADNPAFRLYRREGFVINKEIVNRVGTKSYTMIMRFR